MARKTNRKNFMDRLKDFVKDKEITIYTDYHDFENVEQLLYREVKTQYGYTRKEKIDREAFEEMIIDAYIDSTSYDYDELAKNFLRNLENENENLYSWYCKNEDDLFDNIQDALHDIPVNYPIDDFLKQTIKVNIFAYGGENTSGYNDEWLIPLLHSQGYKLKEHRYIRKCLSSLCAYYKESLNAKDEKQAKADKQDAFLNSLQQEIYNCYLDSPRELCFIAEVSIEDYFNMISKNCKSITISKDAMCGLVDPYNGGGSVLELELNKDITIPKDKFYLKVEGIDKYSVDEIYGLVGSCFKDCVSVNGVE